MGLEIKIYGYKIEQQVLSVSIFDDELIQVTAQVFHAYESRYIERFKRTYGFHQRYVTIVIQLIGTNSP